MDDECNQCGYDLSGITAGVCPECGAARQQGEAPIRTEVVLHLVLCAWCNGLTILPAFMAPMYLPRFPMSRFVHMSPYFIALACLTTTLLVVQWSGTRHIRGQRSRVVRRVVSGVGVLCVVAYFVMLNQV